LLASPTGLEAEPNNNRYPPIPPITNITIAKLTLEKW